MKNAIDNQESDDMQFTLECPSEIANVETTTQEKGAEEEIYRCDKTLDMFAAESNLAGSNMREMK